MNCSHIVAVYFSPTHTSRRIAREVARGTGLGLLAEIDLTCEAGCDPIALPKDALILLAAPVYGGRVSPTALERLARLRGQGQAAVAVVVYGNRDYEDALLELSDRAKDWGLTPVAAGAFIGEHSYSRPSLPVAEGRPDEDDLKRCRDFAAAVMEKLQGQQTVMLGKLNMDEFAMGSSTENSYYKVTRNPRNLDCVPGGSSGGSAAAVASGEAVVALGSDTGGSIRQPASFCGVVGMKPTYGVVSRYGVVAFGSSLDQVGPFARSVEDAAAAMDALCGHDPLDCTSQDVKAGFRTACQQDVAGMRIGVVRSFMDAKGLSSEVSERVSEAAAKLEAAGATIVEVDLPHIDAAISAYYVLGPCEAFSNLARFDSVRYGYCEEGHKDLGSQYEASRAHGFGEEAKRRIMLGSYLLSAGVYEQYYYPAQQVRTLITQDYRNAYEQCDVILAPTAPATAFKFGEIADPATMYLSDVFTISINIAGNGGMSVPCGLGAQSGMPVGVQLIAPQFKDENMFRAAMALEAAYGKAPVAPNFADGKVIE